MKGIPIFAVEQYQKYLSKLQSSALVAEGQLVFLNQSLRDVISDATLDNNSKYFKASNIYADMLRIFYIIDRMHSADEESNKKTESVIDFVSSIASSDIHDFVKQVQGMDTHISRVNNEYIGKGLLQKAVVNKTIIDQATLWISNKNEDFKEASHFFSSESYQNAIASLNQSASHFANPTADSFSEQQKYNTWQFLLSNLKESFTKVRRFNSSSLSSEKYSESSSESYRTFVKYNSQSKEELLFDNIFAQQIRSFNEKSNEPELPIDNIKDQVFLDLVNRVGVESTGDISFVKPQSMFGNLDYTEGSVHKKINGSIVEYFRIEDVVSSLLNFMQAEAISANANNVYDYEIYSQEKLLRNFIIDGNINIPKKVDADQMNFFNAVINEVDFIRDTEYQLYKLMHELCLKDESNKPLEVARSYLISPQFFGRLQWMIQRGNFFGHMNQSDKFRMFSRLTSIMKSYAFSVDCLYNGFSEGAYYSQKKLLSKEEWANNLRYTNIFDQLQHYDTSFSDFTYLYTQPSLRSVAIIERASVAHKEPLDGLENVAIALRYGKFMQALPRELVAKIVTDYIYLDGFKNGKSNFDVMNKLSGVLNKAFNKGSEEYNELSLIRQSNASGVSYDKSKIFAAISDDSHSQVKAILEDSSVLSLTNDRGLTPIKYAVELDNAKMLQRLMLAVKNDGNKYPLPLKFAVKNNSFNCLNLMLDVMGVDNLKPGLLHIAVQDKNIEMVRFLIKKGISTELLDAKNKKAFDYTTIEDASLRDVLLGKHVKASPNIDLKGVLSKSNSINLYSNLASFFSRQGSGVKHSDIIFRSLVIVSYALAISCFVASFFYPINMLLNLCMIFCYAAVILDSYVNNIVLPSSSKISNVQVNNFVVGGDAVKSLNVSNSLLFSVEKSFLDSEKDSVRKDSVSDCSAKDKVISEDKVIPMNFLYKV
jgi:hypothetical protein